MKGKSMNKYIHRFAIVMGLLAMAAAPAFAQTKTINTTLSAAVSTVAAGQSSTISVTSTTGMTASTASVQTFILVDKEVMRVTSLSPFQVTRGEMGSQVSAHVSGAYVFYGTAGNWSNNS